LPPVLAIERGNEVIDLSFGDRDLGPDHLIGDPGRQEDADHTVVGGALLNLVAVRAAEAVGAAAMSGLEAKRQIPGRHLYITAEWAAGSDGGHQAVSPEIPTVLSPLSEDLGAP
jgi:hypothetical protein